MTQLVYCACCEHAVSDAIDICPHCGHPLTANVSRAPAIPKARPIPRENSGRIRHFYTKVVGVSHRNDDGSSRQKAIKGCDIGETLLLEHDEDNAYDANAIHVCRDNGGQLGFLASDIAEDVVRDSATGVTFTAFVTSLTGGTRDKPTRGVNILILVADPDVTPNEAKQYIDRNVSEFSASTALRKTPAVQTVEQTGKAWKAIMGVGTLCIIAGLGTCVMAAGISASPAWAVMGVLLLAMGVGCYCAGRIGAWWHHG